MLLVGRSMGKNGYSLRRMFGAVTLLSVIAWALTAPSEPSCLAAVLASALAGAVYGRARRDHPVGYGAAAGAFGVALLILGFWALHWGGYFFHDGPEEYFEDGLVTEGFVFPVVYCLVYAPLGALAGVIVGFIVWLLGDRIGRPARAERTRLREDPFVL
jgi:hypothetical protein